MVLTQPYEKKWRLEPLPSNSGTRVVNQDDEDYYDYTFCPNLVRGVPHPPFIDPKLWELQREKLSFREGDVVVCTFSKCGTTLMEQIVLLLLNGGDTSLMDPLFKNTMDPNNPSRLGKIWPEMAVVDGLEEEEEGENKDNDIAVEKKKKHQGIEKSCMGEGRARMSLKQFHALPQQRRVIKSHAPRQLFLGQDHTTQKLTKGIKIIYVTRNPFDAAVSCYYHPKPGVSPATTGCSFDAFVKLWSSDRIEFGGWAKHINGWYKELQVQEHNTADKQMIWMTYEDLIQNPAESVRKVASFLNIPADQDLIEKVVIGCRFDSMKTAATKALESGVSGNVSHLRKGCIGDWKNHFTDSLKEEFETELSKVVEIPDMQFNIGNDDSWTLLCNSKLQNSSIIKRRHVNIPCTKDSVDDNHTSIRKNTTLLTDIKVIGITLIFLNALQTVLSYLNEFYVDDYRDGGLGQKPPDDISIITIVFANIFNGISAGIAVGSYFCIRKAISHHWSGIWNKKCAKYFMISNIVEAVITSGVMHSIFHRIYGAISVMGNGYVEFFFHLGYTINVIVTSFFLINWISYEQKLTVRALVKPLDLILGVIACGLGLCFSLIWVQYITNNVDLDFDLEHSGHYDLLNFLQGRVQAVVESILLIPSVVFLFVLLRLWKNIKNDSSLSQQQSIAYKVFILSVVVPLSMNWLHFRFHDSLIHPIRAWLGISYAQFITIIRVCIHIPNWILSVLRNHHFRRLTEEKEGTTITHIRYTLYPGGSIFPFLMIFVYRASEGMTLSILPVFFQGSTATNNFHLDITDNKWVAATVLGMFLANALGSICLGNLMQLKGYVCSYMLVIFLFAVLFPMFMIPQTKTSFLVLRCITSLLFPGPVVLSRITQSTRNIYRGSLSHIPMVVALIWFNQGFATGGLLSASQVFTSWNVFFTSSLVLAIFSLSILVAFIVVNRNNEGTSDSSDAESDNIIKSISPTINHEHYMFPIKMNIADSEEDERNNMNDTSLLRDETDATDATSFPTNASTTIQKHENEEQIQDVIGANENGKEKSSKIDAISSLWFAKVASFLNGLSFACHVALLGIQVTNIVTLDKYEYTILVSSLGTVSTILILLSFQFLALRGNSVNIFVSTLGHIIGTAILGVPQIYHLPRGFAVMIIICAYALVFLSFFMLNLSCENIVKEESIKEKERDEGLPLTRTTDTKSGGKDAAAGKQMGQVKASLSLGKVCGSVTVLFAHEIHPQLPIWTVEGLLVAGLLFFMLVACRIDPSIHVGYFSKRDA